jgi:hypothetical protein
MEAKLSSVLGSLRGLLLQGQIRRFDLYLLVARRRNDNECDREQNSSNETEQVEIIHDRASSCQIAIEITPLAPA